MDFMNQEEKNEYLRFISELINKANKITKEYNKLSDNNKYRIYLFLKRTVWAGITLCKR